MGCLESRSHTPFSIRRRQFLLGVGEPMHRVHRIDMAHQSLQFHGRNRRIGRYGSGMREWVGAVLLRVNGLPSYARLSWILAAASLGFLVWNWPPAKIFMGDVGSGFLGFTLGTLALFSSKAGPELIWPWLILLAAFLVDATVTLLRRMFSRARWHEAHQKSRLPTLPLEQWAVTRR